MLEIATTLEARALTWHGLRYGIDDPDKVSAFLESAAWAGEKARASGIVLCIENVSWCYLRTPEHVATILQAGLPSASPSMPSRLAKATQTASPCIAMDSRLTTVHLADYAPGNCATCRLARAPGLAGIARALQMVGYEGPLILEPAHVTDLSILPRAREFVRAGDGRCGANGERSTLRADMQTLRPPIAPHRCAPGLCLACIRSRPEEAPPLAVTAHAGGRAPLWAAGTAASALAGRRCRLCVNLASWARASAGTAACARCENRRVAATWPVRPPGSAPLVPRPAAHPLRRRPDLRRGTPRGMHNLAVFYPPCTLDCLFCQNWHFRDADAQRCYAYPSADGTGRRRQRAHPLRLLLSAATRPAQMPHALPPAAPGRAGSFRLLGNGRDLQSPTDGPGWALSLETGGCVKFDLKAYGETLHLCLTGANKA